MTDKMTPERLDEIEERADNATEEPWDTWYIQSQLKHGPNDNFSDYRDNCLGGRPTNMIYGKEDAEFISHSRADVPAMAAEIRRCWAELATAKSAAVQWVTYEGTPETLPRASDPVLVWLNELPRLKRPAFIARAVAVYTIPAWQRGDDNPELQIKHGDRWAYLPTPPEASE